MKKVFIVFISCLFVVTGCKQRSFFDINSPEIIYTTLLPDDNFLIQFNEPITNFEYFINESFDKIDIFFPKSNLQIPVDNLKKIKGKNIMVKASDTSGNLREYEIIKPLINEYPVQLEINEIQLKYSKKSPQKITLKAINSGYTIGYKIFALIRNDIIKFEFNDFYMSKNEKIELIFEPSENEFNNNKKINKNKNIIAYKGFRLSPSSSLLYILDNRDKLLDHILYIDTKSNDTDYYRTKSRNFKRGYTEILKITQNPVITDVKGTTIRKKIKKHNGKFRVTDN